MPIGHLRDGTEQAGGRLVEGLVGRDTPDAVVNPGAAPRRRLGPPRTVQTTRPAHVSGPVVLLGPLPLQHRLGAPVAELLPPVRADGVTAMMPDHRGRVEADRPAALLQAPADVHVITRHAEL